MSVRENYFCNFFITVEDPIYTKQTKKTLKPGSSKTFASIIFLHLAACCQEYNLFYQHNLCPY